MDEKYRCSAKAKSTGERCKRARAQGRQVCVIHGGRSPRGIKAGRWKHGRYSQTIARKLVEIYEHVIEDPARYTFDRNVARLDALFADVCGDIDEAGEVTDSCFSRYIKTLTELRRTIEAELTRRHRADLVLTADQALAFAMKMFEMHTAVLFSREWAQELGIGQEEWKRVSRLIGQKIADACEHELLRATGTKHLEPKLN